MQIMTYSKNIIDNIFGGIRPTSRALGKAATTIQGWHDSGTIPQKHWTDIINAAKSFDHTLNSEDFFPKQLSRLESFGYPFNKLHCLSIDDFGTGYTSMMQTNSPKDDFIKFLQKKFLS